MFIIRKQAAKLFYKIRHHQGHGIHSPFVFNFIINVVENKHTFYAFGDIKKHIESQLKKEHKGKKFNKLVFKTINYFNLKNILILGSGNGINLLYVSAPSLKTTCICIEEKEANRQKASTLLHSWSKKIEIKPNLPKNDFIFDCIVLDMNFLGEKKSTIDDIFSHVDEKSVVILNNIRTNSYIYSLVRNMRKDERVRISLDLYSAAVFFFDKKYFKRNYKISF